MTNHIIPKHIAAMMDTVGAQWLGRDKRADDAVRRFRGDPDV